MNGSPTCIVGRWLGPPSRELVARHGGAMDSVAAGLRAHVQDRVADAGRAAVEDAVGAGDAAGEGVDQDVPVVARVELHLAAHRRHADAVAVAGDARDHAAEELGRAGVVRAPKRSEFRLAIGRAPMVKTSRRMPPTPGGRALVGLDEAGVVVRLHLEDGGVAVADVDDARVLARALDDARPLGGQPPQVHARGSCRSSARSTSR